MNKTKRHGKIKQKARDLQLETPWREDRRRDLQMNSGFEVDRSETIRRRRFQLDPSFSELKLEPVEKWAVVVIEG